MKIQGLNYSGARAKPAEEAPKKYVRPAANEAKLEISKEGLEAARKVEEAPKAAAPEATLSKLITEVKYASIDPVDKAILRNMVENGFRGLKTDSEKQEFVQAVQAWIKTKEQKYSVNII